MPIDSNIRRILARIYGITGAIRDVESQIDRLAKKLISIKNSSNFIQAELTFSMGHPKLGHYFNTGLESTGDLYIKDIGFKPLNKDQYHIQLIELEDVFSCVPMHGKNTHKYTRGKLISISGSSGYPGASILAVDSALTTGSGIIKMLVPESLRNLYENCLTEAIMVPMYDNNTGTFIQENTNEILIEIEWADAILFGPGLQIDSVAVEWMSEVLKNINKLKILLANEATTLLHGSKAAKDSEETARTTFVQGGVGKNIPEKKISSDSFRGNFGPKTRV